VQPTVALSLFYFQNGREQAFFAREKAAAVVTCIPKHAFHLPIRPSFHNDDSLYFTIFSSPQIATMKLTDLL
jgi:hypothetical protein